MSQQAHWSTIKERGSLLGIRCLVTIYKAFGKGFQSLLFPGDVVFLSHWRASPSRDPQILA